MAQGLMDELLVLLLGGVELAMVAGHTGDHYYMIRQAFHHISYSLNLVGPGTAVCTAEALDVLWSDQCEDGCTGHMDFFEEADLQAIFLNCIRTIQDAIGMCMIRDGDMQQVMDRESLSLNTKCRLRNAFFIQKRYLREVGLHMISMGEETHLDHSAGRTERGQR
jgi:hypothetical protein